MRAVLIAVLAVLVLGAASARADTGYVIKQREGASRSKLLLAPAGLRFDALAPTRHKGRAKPQVGIILRYADRHLFLLDPKRRRFDSLGLSSATKSYAAELKLARRGQPSARLPKPPKGSTRATGHQIRVKLPRARLHALKLTRRIGPVRARAYLLRSGKVRQRLWYSAALPVPPARVRRLLAKSVGSAAKGSLNGALRSRSGRVPLRIDERIRKHWRTVLRTKSIRRRTVSARALKPPKGYKERTLLDGASAGKAHASDVPATALRCAFVINCFGLLQGPISEHPSLYAFYWGSHYKDRLDFVSSINGALHNFVGDQFADPNSQDFWGPLDQYGVHRGKLLGYEVVDENPDDSVGSWNFFDVEWFVETHRFGSDAPNYWWRWSDEDPIFAIFVDQSEVDSSGWGGYHFFTPTEGLLFAFLAHPNMPWLIVKTPDVASLPTNRSDPAYKAAVDKTTERASHEFVEAATDPYPFLSWADPLKEPIWEQGEIADICSQGDIAPWAENTRVLKGSTALSTYWSNSDDACMPESRPSVSIFEPPDGSTMGLHGRVTFGGNADDLFDGSVADSQYVWSDDGTTLGTGRFFSTTALAPGAHHVSLTVRNSQGGVRTAGPVTVNVVVNPPDLVRIDSPTEGSSFGSDQIINMRGAVHDPQDGDVNDQATWLVDGTPVGTGAQLFQTNIPTQGPHTITLSYTNTGGLTGSASVHVDVGPPTGKPTVTITEPALQPGFDDRFVTPGVPFKLTAVADAQGVATIADPGGYTWTADVPSAFHPQTTNKGSSIMATLDEGTYFVSCTVTDSMGRTNFDTIKIISQPIIPRPRGAPTR